MGLYSKVVMECLKQQCIQMVKAFLETTMHPNGRFQMANAVLEITMLEITMHSNGIRTLGNNSALKWQMHSWKQ
jgi:hypothetical protein